TSSPFVRPMTVGEYLQRHPPQDTLPRLAAGSWIAHNFAIWVGHEEDNAAWDALHRARSHLLEAQTGRPGGRETRRQGDREKGSGGEAGRSEGGSGLPSASPLERAWEEVYVAEASDWFWWFGDDHSSAQDALFDYLFRKHLQNVYLLLGDDPPPELSRAISRRGHRVLYTPPRALLGVTVDGRSTFFEWVGAGRYTCGQERGAMAMAMQGPLREVYFGFDLERLLVRIDCEGPARAALADYDEWRVGFVEPAGFEVRVTAPGRPGQGVQLLRRGEPVTAAG